MQDSPRSQLTILSKTHSPELCESEGLSSDKAAYLVFGEGISGCLKKRSSVVYQKGSPIWS